MAGVFEVEVDGVEHDHGLEHHDEPNQVRGTGLTGPTRQKNRSGGEICRSVGGQSGTLVLAATNALAQRRKRATATEPSVTMQRFSVC